MLAKWKKQCVCGAALLIWLVPDFAGAQSEPPREMATAAGIETVIVTARKRSETDISVPASVTAMSAEQLQQHAVQNMYDIAATNPMLMINNSSGAIGGAIYVRGVGTEVTSVNSLDQSVSIDVDGVPFSRGNMLRIGNYDLNELQILKGPQALFFGKNSSAGVIAMTSKDPTDEFEIVAKGSYEPDSNGRFGEFTISGPLSDTLKARLFAHIGSVDGEKTDISSLALSANAVVPGAVIPISGNRIWGYSEDFGRATALYEPDERFSLRLKASYDSQDGIGPGALKEVYYCPQGKPQMTAIASNLGGGINTPALASALQVDDCKANGVVSSGGINPAVFNTATGLPSADTDGATLDRIFVASAEANYKLTDHVDLTSVTGYGNIVERSYTSFSYGPESLPSRDFQQLFSDHQFSEEFRAQSNFDFPLNAMVGLYYENSGLKTFTRQFAAPPATYWIYSIPNTVLSAFGQLTWNVTDEIELAGGVRYTKETKNLTLTKNMVDQPTANPSVAFYNASPEATLTWRPSSDFTLYGAFKTGYKSGGYSASQAGNAADIPQTPPYKDFSYRPENALGGEVGMKSLWMDNSVRIDVTLYNYKYNDLQVNHNITLPNGNVVLQILNAATVKQRGAEAQLTYAPVLVPGLLLQGMVNYNEANFLDFISPCYIGQSIAEGCNLNPSSTGAYREQDLSGHQLTNAPLWVGTLGLDYALPVSSMEMNLGADVSYRSSYNPTSDGAPFGEQSPSAVLNLHIQLKGKDGDWEVGIFGKNLTNVYRIVDNSTVGFTGNQANTGTALGGVMSRADLAGNTNLGRQVFIQLTLRPLDWL